MRPIDRLIAGNNRYANAKLQHPHQSLQRLKEISEAQNPFAVVVSCSDSRVPPEIIYDQGLGDLFVIRTAGNIIGDYELASIEYAILKLNCKVVVVTGHETCGAIKAFMEQPKDSLSGHLSNLLEFIRSEANSENILKSRPETGSDERNYQLVIHNIIYGVNLLKEQSTIAREKYDKGELEIYGAIYHMGSGKIQVIEDDVKK